MYNEDFDISCRYVCSPPLRKKNDIKSLWNNIKNKNIDMVSTDHCSFTFEQKKIGIDDFTKIPSGLNCIEQRALVMFDAVFHKKISKEVMCKVLCENQAKIFGLYDRKGFLKQGYDADIVILNPNETTVFSSKTQMTKSDYCLFEKKRMKGKIEKVFLRGSLVVDNGVIVKERVGEFVKRKKSLV